MLSHDNRGATTEPGEPTNNSGDPRESERQSGIWLSHDERTVTFDTCISSFDTTLGVYEGPTLPLLERVAFNDDFLGCEFSTGQLNSDASRVTFNAKPGILYRIQVGGARSPNTTGEFEEGSFTLKWASVVP